MPLLSSLASLVLSLHNIVRKEIVQALRDKRMLFMLVAAPVIQLVMLGYAVNLDVDKIPTVVCDEDETEASRDLSREMVAEGTFLHEANVDTPEAAQAALESGEAAVAVIVPRGFAVRLARRDDPEVQVIVDGTDSVRAQVAINDAMQFLMLKGIGAPPRTAPPPPLTPRILYNPRLKSVLYMLPGIAGSLLLNITTMVAAMGLARERETGTLEQVLVTPIQPVVLLAGKCVPFILFGLLDVVGILAVGSWLFDVPIRGSFLVLGVGAFLYLFSTLGVGILLSTFSASQQQAILSGFSFILPAMLLSGFASPIESMPAWLQPITLLNPMRHFVEIMRGCMLKGAGFADLAPQFAWLAGLGPVILGASVVRFNRRLA